MLKRTLEPEVMDSPSEADDYDMMDHGPANDAFVSDLLAGAKVETNVLDLGTGTAAIPILLCDQVIDCRVVAVDASISMLELARHRVVESGHEGRLQLDHSDAKSFTWNDELFHTIISNSLIHHLPQPSEVIKRLPEFLLPGGRVFFRDLLRPDSAAEVERLVKTYFGEESDSCQQLFRQSLHAALTIDEMQEMLSQAGFDAHTVKKTTDRHWTWDAVLGR